MTQPLISVITVTRNNLVELRSTLESVFAQNYTNIQSIVIDGASIDGTTEFLQLLGNKIEYLSEPDKGIYDAMNKGLLMVRGEWVIFMNSGDRFATPVSLSAFVENISNGVALVYSDYLRPAMRNPSDLYRCRSRKLMGIGGNIRMICHQVILFNRLHLPKQFDNSLKLCADLDILLSIYTRKSGFFRYIAEPLVVYQGGGVSEQDYITLHREREIVIGRYFGKPVRMANYINHLRIRINNSAYSYYKKMVKLVRGDGL